MSPTPESVWKNLRSACFSQTLNARSMVAITRSSERSLEGNLVTRHVSLFLSHLTRTVTRDT